MTNTNYNLPWSYPQQWEVGQMLLYPYDGYTDLTPQASDAAAVAAGAAREDRYTPPDFSDTIPNTSNLFVVFDKPAGLVGPTGVVVITSVRDDDMVNIADGGSVLDSATPLSALVTLGSCGAVVGDSVRLYSGTGTGSPIGTAVVLDASHIAAGTVRVSTGVYTAGAKTFTARVTKVAGGLAATASNVWDVTVTS